MKKTICLAIALCLLTFCAAIKEYQATYREELEKADEERFGSNKPKPESPVSTSQEKTPYEIIVVKHPDLNFPPTDSNSVVIYEGGFMPLDDKFFVIAKIGTLESGGTFEDEELKNELKLKAAEIGGHALIMIDLKTESREFGGGVTAKSFPQYFWWFYPGEGLKREYTGTEYYVFELPKQTITSYSRIYSVIKFTKKWDIEFRSSLKKKLRSGMEEAIRKSAEYRGEKMDEESWETVDAAIAILCEDYPFATAKRVIEICVDKLEKGGDFKLSLEQAFKLSHEESVGEILQPYKERYPLADNDEFAMLIMARDENGEFLYTIEEAAKISHQNKKRFPDQLSKIEKRFQMKG